jgi:hypothetical protein
MGDLSEAQKPLRKASSGALRLDQLEEMLVGAGPQIKV